MEFFHPGNIHDSIQYIKEFVGTMTREEFLSDEKTRSAVAFKIENIGEASKNVPKEIKAKYKELPWTKMARMRDKITHFYFGIDYKVVWLVVKKELPAIEPVVIKVLIDAGIKPIPKITLRKKAQGKTIPGKTFIRKRKRTTNR